MTTLPTWRLHLLRLGYLVIAVGLGVFIVPRLIWLPTDWTVQSATVTSFLTALSALCVVGVFRPLEMLPLLLFELGWKFVYMLRIALPAMLGDTLSADFEALFWECVPILLYLPIIPWTYVWQTLGPRRAPHPA